MRERNRWLEGLIGLGAAGAALSGILAFILALAYLLGGDPFAAALFLVAASVAFGLLLVALVPR